MLTREDQEDYRNDEDSLVRITSRVCIDLMRLGFEVRSDVYTKGTPVRRRGPEVQPKIVRSFEEMVETFGPLVKPKKEPEE